MSFFPLKDAVLIPCKQFSNGFQNKFPVVTISSLFLAVISFSYMLTAEWIQMFCHMIPSYILFYYLFILFYYYHKAGTSIGKKSLKTLWHLGGGMYSRCLNS